MIEHLKSYILQHFKYNPESGEIIRNDRKNSSGSLDKDGYLIIKIKGNQIKAHRLAWFLYYGDFPKNEIDHINRIRTDNSIKNLRDVTHQENILNTTKHRNKDTGQYGIYIDKCTKQLKAIYTFRIKNKTYRFRLLEDAIKAKEELCNA